MNKDNLLDKILSDLRGVFPTTLSRDIEQNLRAALAATLSRLNLVTREELDVQTAVLARTRARLEELEKKIAELEINTPKK